MQQEHKEALANGRRVGNAVERYLEHLRETEASSTRRTVEQIQARLADINVEMQGATAARTVQLIQERHDLVRELNLRSDHERLATLETEFIAVAREYSERKGIKYAAFREFGVPSAVLRKAGVSR